MKRFSIFFFVVFLTLAGFLVATGCGEGGTSTGNPNDGSNTDDEEEGTAGDDEGSDNSDDGDSEADEPIESSAQDEEQACLDAGGEWTTFSDGCADSCNSQRQVDIDCIQVITESCECGDACWNNETGECEEI